VTVRRSTARDGLPCGAVGYIRRLSLYKLCLIGRTEMVDKNTGKVIGHFVYTIWTNLDEQRNELLDVDITLCNENRTSVRFLNCLPASSDSNE